MIKKIYLLACPALLALSSCTSEVNDDNFIDKTNSISFAAYPTKSRAVGADITSENMIGDKFGVAGYSNNNLYWYTGTEAGVAQQYVTSSNSWEYANMADLKYWPETDMDFYAYFPYSDNATFAASNASGNVMTITGVDCSHDVLFAYVGGQTKIDRVPLTFHHAFSKIKTLQIEMAAEGIVYKSGCNVEVKGAEFIYTRTKGNVKVNNTGIASYNVAESNLALTETLASAVTINSTNTSTNIIDYGTNAKGYFFATNGSTAVNNVIGTGALMWDGVKESIGETGKLSTSGLVCLKLTCKVWNGATGKEQYYVGGAGTYGEVYIPLKGTDSESNLVSTFDAGKRYIYKIVMKDNVGFTDAGDPILTPILFSVAGVDNWGDVTVTITL
ncbi:MAG: fimbrillin family protein [Muribaculaceae bacterium]